MSVVTDSWAPNQDELLDKAAGLITPPTVCVRLLALLRSSKASASDIASVVSYDPNLAARLLRVANSSYYGLRRRVQTVQRAVTLLGARDLSNFAIAISMTRTYSALGGGLYDAERFWRHSVYVALTAQQLAKHVGMGGSNRLFVAGLLHDVGSPLLYFERPDLVRKMSQTVASDEDVVAAQERAEFGFSHDSLGARMLSKWELPDEIVELVRDHHGAPQVDQSEQSILETSDQLSQWSERGALAFIEAERRDFGLCARFGLAVSERYPTLLNTVDRDFDQIIDALGG